MVVALKRRSLKIAVGHVSNGARALDRGAVASWPSESRNARRASEFLRTVFTVARGAVAGDSVSDPVGIGGSAVHGAGRGGDIDKRWPLPNARAIENVPTCWGFELVVATLYKLLDVLVRFDATCRLEMILGNFFCDCEEVPLESVRDHGRQRAILPWVWTGKMDTIHQTAWGAKGRRTGETSAAHCLCHPES